MVSKPLLNLSSLTFYKVHCLQPCSSPKSSNLQFHQFTSLSSSNHQSIPKMSESTHHAAIDVAESSKGVKVSIRDEKREYPKGFAIFDFILRLGAIAAALAAAATMGVSDQTLPFFTQFFQFQASYDNFSTFQFFVIAMGLVAAYLVLSLPFSIVSIVRPYAAGPRILLFVFDTVALFLNAAAAAAAADIVYLAHNGNATTNWLAICNQFGDFCRQVSGSVVASFASAVIFLILVIMSGLALRRL